MNETKTVSIPTAEHEILRQGAFDQRRTQQECLAEAVEVWAAKAVPINVHAAVASALRRGDLVQGPCEGCGADEAIAHHDDYDKPLDVRWLCRSCHAKFHAGLLVRLSPLHRATLSIDEAAAECLRSYVYWTPGATLIKATSDAVEAFVLVAEDLRGGPFPPIPTEEQQPKEETKE